MISGSTINERIVFLSEPAPVKMGTEWFDIVDADHFWIRNRFRVFQKITAPLSKKARYAEIGCGTGLFQSQIERDAGISIEGFDLDLEALKKIHPAHHYLFTTFLINARNSSPPMTVFFYLMFWSI